MKKLGLVTCLVILTALFTPGRALGHAERETQFPSGAGHVPKHRSIGPMLVVCKPDSAQRIAEFPSKLRAQNERLLSRCEFHDIQAAVDHVQRAGTRIEILPGHYLEKPSLNEPPPSGCETFYRNSRDRNDTNDVLTYKQQMHCPHAVNLIAWFGDRTPNDDSIACNSRFCRLQLEGTGAQPEDVVVDAGFKRLNVIRADRADGAYFRNFTVQGSTFNGVYVIETDGYAMDDMVFRNNNEYGVLTFSVDHGLIENCEAYGNGDSGVYPGGQMDLHGAYPSTEIRHCFSHHNELGYSGTAGNSTFVHDNVFAYNAVGIVTDSFYGGHPGLPEDSARFVHNRIFSNNKNYNRNYDTGLCDKPYAKWPYYRWHGEMIRAVCPTIPGPIGVGLLIAGGNQNLVARNWIYDNWRYGTFLFWVPAEFRGDSDPDKQYDTSHFNKYIYNRMGMVPSGGYKPNGLDFWWDVEGTGNCWQYNEDPKGITSSPDPSQLPDCNQPPVFYPGPTVSVFASCATWSKEDNHPPGCDWFDKPPKPNRSASSHSIGSLSARLTQGNPSATIDGPSVGFASTPTEASRAALEVLRQSIIAAFALDTYRSPYGNPRRRFK
jgi:hypothetical protein